MWTIVGWSESAAKNGLTVMDAIQDDHVTFVGDNVRPPEWAPHLVAEYGIGSGIARAQLRSPSLRQRWMQHEVRPLDVGAEPAASAGLLAAHLNMPIPLRPGEDVQAFADNANVAARDTVLAVLADGPVHPTSTGGVFTVRLTGTTTLAANALTRVPLTPDEVAPDGEYEIVGMRAESAGLIFARLILPSQPNRPGCIGADSANDADLQALFRHGRMGVFGRFTNQNIPVAEFFSVSADTAETVLLDVRKV